jgi:hypothetical protein
VVLSQLSYCPVSGTDGRSACRNANAILLAAVFCSFKEVEARTHASAQAPSFFSWASCAALQSMQSVVTGRAFKRSTPISSSHSSQRP